MTRGVPGHDRRFRSAHLDCRRARRALARGVDLVVISKFGKQEAARGGLADAFRAAVVAQAPILTAVSPGAAEAWRDFAGSLAEYLPADRQAVEEWWETRRSATAPCIARARTLP